MLELKSKETLLYKVFNNFQKQVDEIKSHEKSLGEIDNVERVNTVAKTLANDLRAVATLVENVASINVGSTYMKQGLSIYYKNEEE